VIPLDRGALHRELQSLLLLRTGCQLRSSKRINSSRARSIVIRQEECQRSERFKRNSEKKEGGWHDDGGSMRKWDIPDSEGNSETI
jgi:hypothetical protein